MENEPGEGGTQLAITEIDLHDEDTEERTSFSEYSNLSLDESRLISSGEQMPELIRTEFQNDTARTGETQEGTQSATQPGNLPSASQMKRLLGAHPVMPTAPVPPAPADMSTPMKTIVPPTPRNALALALAAEEEEDIDAISSEVDESGTGVTRKARKWREISETPQSQAVQVRTLISPTRQGSEDLSQTSLGRTPRTPWSNHFKRRKVNLPQMKPPEPKSVELEQAVTEGEEETELKNRNVTLFAKDSSTNRVKAFNVNRQVYEQAKADESKFVEGTFPFQSEAVSAAFNSTWLAHIEVGDSVMLDIDGRRGKAYTVLDTFEGPDSGYSMRDSGHNMLRVSRSLSTTSSPKSKRRRKSVSEDPENVSLGQIYLNQQLFVAWLKKHDVSSINKLRYENNLLVYAHGHRKARPQSVYESDDEGTKIEPSSSAGALPQETEMVEIKMKGQPFVNCAFSVSMSNDPRANKVLALIRAGGGVVLDQGLRDRVVLDGTKIKSWDFDPSETFAGVIAAGQIRTVKYLEMAACGWPILSYEFIYDAAEQGTIESWREYVMAAGTDNDQVCWSLDFSVFAERWAAGVALSSQFAQRRLLLGGIRPRLHILTSGGAAEQAIVYLVSLMSHDVHIVTSLAKVPAGSLVIDLADMTKSVATDRQVLRALQRDASLESTLVVGKDWLISCIISGKLV